MLRSCVLKKREGERGEKKKRKLCFVILTWPLGFVAVKKVTAKAKKCLHFFCHFIFIFYFILLFIYFFVYLLFFFFFVKEEFIKENLYVKVNGVYPQ